jgi:hypothetical protein
MFVKLIVKAINEINEMKLCNFFLNILSYVFLEWIVECILENALELISKNT